MTDRLRAAFRYVPTLAVLLHCLPRYNLTIFTGVHHAPHASFKPLLVSQIFPFNYNTVCRVVPAYR